MVGRIAYPSPLHMTAALSRPLRSALYLPASNPRAIDKARLLPADVIIFDLEDAVAPDAKDAAREHLLAAFAQGGFGSRRLVIRVNHPLTPYFDRDVQVAMACAPHAILVPKISNPVDIGQACLGMVRTAPDASKRPALWAMIETAEALTGLAAIAQAGLAAPVPLQCLVVGTNDIARETGVSMLDQRQYMVPWLMNIVLVARRYGLAVLDGVWNDFRDTTGYEAEVTQSKAMGFDGKTLIHPSQIEAANAVFAPSAAEIGEARAIVEAFEQPEHAGAGVINLGGRMVERLHRDMARRVLSLDEAIRAARI